VLDRVPVPVIDEDVEAGYWRARAERAEALAAGLRAENAGLTARVAELAGQVAGLQESVTTLSGLLFGSSSEKGGSPLRRTGREGGGRPAGAGKRGQRPGGPGHGRRDHSHLETEERVIDVDARQRCCAECKDAPAAVSPAIPAWVQVPARNPGDPAQLAQASPSHDTEGHSAMPSGHHNTIFHGFPDYLHLRARSTSPG